MRYLLLLLLAIPAVAQSDLPDRGTLADIEGKIKIYIDADAEHIRPIEKAIKKPFSIASKVAEAEIFLEYKTLSTQEVTSMKLILETGQLTAYFYRDKQKIVVWMASDSKGGAGGPANNLTKRFIKELGKKR
jgi:hypothetical protein